MITGGRKVFFAAKDMCEQFTAVFGCFGGVWWCGLGIILESDKFVGSSVLK